MDKAKIQKPQRIWLFALFAIAWCSGVAFFILKTWFIVEGEFGLEKHPFQFPALQVHGFVAFLMMITYGYVMGTHVRDTWEEKPKQAFGILLVALPAFQMITAYLLYYIAKEELRETIEYLHLGVGFTLPFILMTHVLHNKNINASQIANKLVKEKLKAKEKKLEVGLSTSSSTAELQEDLEQAEIK